jgi:DNA polymerase
MFIGEAPGEEEDLQGMPFVGKAGKLLNSLIDRMGLQRQGVYISNVVKCRPPGNRDPEPDEIATCKPFLLSQIEVIKPRVIIALGSVSSQSLLNTTTPITALRGQVHDFLGISLIPTFHPAYLLRNPKAKWDTWEDAQRALKILSEKKF